MTDRPAQEPRLPHCTDCYETGYDIGQAEARAADSSVTPPAALLNVEAEIVLRRLVDAWDNPRYRHGRETRFSRELVAARHLLRRITAPPPSDERAARDLARATPPAFDARPCTVECCDEQEQRHIHEGSHHDHVGDGRWCIDCDVVIGKPGENVSAPPATPRLPADEVYGFTCAYCVGDGIDRPTWYDRGGFERHMGSMHDGLPYEWQGVSPVDALDVERLAEAMRRVGNIVYDAVDESDDMCPNCVTPWKCNGPHELITKPDANVKEAEAIAAEYARLSGSEEGSPATERSREQD